MTDEKYLFISDVKEKKDIARSSRNKRTHCGKGGTVRFPHDHLTKKELNNMNGEVKYYRLNEPMTWSEFKALPSDIKISYIKLIRERFGVSDSKIAEMLGVEQTSFSGMVRRLGINMGRGHGKRGGDTEGFVAWCNGVPLPAKDEPEEASCEDSFEPTPATEFKAAPVLGEKAKSVPCCGSMTFDGAASDALDAIGVLLGGANVRITVMWEVRPEEGACDE